eukprot:4856240-Pyramimonas_sp.AAC.2
MSRMGPRPRPAVTRMDGDASVDLPSPSSYMDGRVDPRVARIRTPTRRLAGVGHRVIATVREERRRNRKGRYGRRARTAAL